MYGNIVIFSILLRLSLSLESPNATIYVGPLYDDDDLKKIQHQGELLSYANEDLRFRMEIIKQLQGQQAEVLKEIKENLSAIERTSVTSTVFDTTIKNLELRMEISEERLGKVLNEINEKLSAIEKNSGTSTALDTAIKKLELWMESNDQRLEKVLDEVKENQSAEESASATTNERLDRHTEMLKEIHGRLQGVEENGNITVYSTSCLKLSKGVQTIQINRFGPQPFRVLCDYTTRGGGWTVIQRRLDGSVDFDRNWTDYKRGFGNLRGEFFLGLDKIYGMTNSSVYELLIVLRDNENTEAFAKYDAFSIRDENGDYGIHILGNYNGTAGDSLRAHMFGSFGTKDKGDSCAKVLPPWWYPARGCGTGGLNGQYGKGIFWSGFHEISYSLPYAAMMIRPRRMNRITR